MTQTQPPHNQISKDNYSNTPWLIVTSNPAHQVQVIQEKLTRLPEWQKIMADRGNQLEIPAEHPDLKWINPENEKISIEMVRNLISEVSYPPYELPMRSMVLLQVQSASIPAQNAMLKILEEPPSYLQLILTVNDLSALLPTVISRCKVIELANNNSSLEKLKAEKSHNSSLPNYTEILSELENGSYTTAIKKATAYKDRGEAQTLILHLIQSAHQELENKPLEKTAQHLKVLLESQKMLSQNVNTQLVLEETFFGLVG